MIAKCFKIECLTNMHVGNGDANFNIIDKEVEKDPVLQTPTIHASGVKGALREHLRSKQSKNEVAFFGKPNDKDDTELGQGRIKILSANLLVLPMRSTDRNAFYYMVTNRESVKMFDELNRAFGIKGLNVSLESNKKVSVEGVECAYTSDKVSVLNENVAVMEAESFKRVPLPVVARNRVNDGSNLWYEEIVPHKSVFYFYAIADDSDKTLMDEFVKEICGIVQFGGNASVGYGVTCVSLIGGNGNE